MNRQPRHFRVVKLGGSLLDLPELPERMATWRSNQADIPTIWVVGGGQPVERLRRRYDECETSPNAAHWQCIELMDANSAAVAKSFPEWKFLSEFESQFANRVPSDQFILVSRWLRQSETGLPESWDVTSDSIAAKIATEIGAVELVLLKSCNAPVADDISDLSASGFVDAYFEMAMRECNLHLSLRVVNFRSSDFPETNFVISSDHSPMDC